MNKIYLLGMIACALVLSAPSVSRAEETATTNADVDVSVSADVDTSGRQKPPVDIKSRIRENSDLRQQNRKDARAVASSTRMDKKDINTTARMEAKDAREEGKIMRKNASSSMERKENRKNVRMEVFQARQKRLVAQLELALTNLKQVRTRIISRIEKSEAANRDMTEARKLILIADTKITLAAQEIASLATYTPPVTASSTATTTDSSEIELSKPREFSNAAIKAVKVAHKSLVDVIVAIAQNMGVKGEVRATTTSATTTTQ